ncbi:MULTISPECIES: NifU family protein [Actinomadura]|uniref:NIF system FeS cluster assembly NifU C-terminal domain-containing protein n=1 Tax=Actinomadura miaoliensis TaxID=430685 RepID=A0ABP7X3R1_9ACTN
MVEPHAAEREPRPPAAAPAGGGPRRLGDTAVAERLTLLERLLARLEQTPGPTAETALDAVAVLTEVYGEALARVMDRTGPEPAAALTADELVGHLLALHGLHPATVEERVRGALEEVRPYLRSHGGDVELSGIDGDVARVRLTGGCGSCASSARTLETAVKDVVLAAVPELSAVEQVPSGPDDSAPNGSAGGGRAGAPAAFVPVEALLRTRRAPGEGAT